MKNRNFFLVFFLVLASLLTSPAFAGEAHDCIVIVLDGSGSMDGRLGNTTKIEAAKQAIHEVLNQAPQNIYVGVVVFSSGVEPWVYPLGPRNNNRLRSAVNNIIASGGTPLADYMKLGANRLLEEKEKQHGYGNYYLLVVTDGEADAGQNVNGITQEILKRGIRLDVIGVDMKKDHALATKAHTYRRADDPESLKKAIASVLAEVGGKKDQVATEEAFAIIAPMPDEMAMAVIKALDTPPSTSNNNQGNNSALGQTNQIQTSSGTSVLKVILLIIVVVIILVFLFGAIRGD